MAMGRKEHQTLTPLELEIMQVLWEHGAGTVAEVRPHLRADLAYTTVQTMLNVLWRKKKVKRVQEGRAFRYAPVVSREGAMGGALRDLVSRMFGGSSEALLMAMVDSRQIDPEDLARIAEKLKDSGQRSAISVQEKQGAGAEDSETRE